MMIYDDLKTVGNNLFQQDNKMTDSKCAKKINFDFLAILELFKVLKNVSLNLNT